MVREFLKKAWRALVRFPSCKEVSTLLSRNQDAPLRGWDRFRLGLHLRVCEGCRNFKNQLDFMRKAMKRYLERGGENSDK